MLKIWLALRERLVVTLLETQELLEGLCDALDESDALGVGEPEPTLDTLVLGEDDPGKVGETVKVGEWEAEGVPDTLLQAVVLCVSDGVEDVERVRVTVAETEALRVAEPDREGLGEALLLAQTLATMLLLRRALAVRDTAALGHCVDASESVCDSVPERLAVELVVGGALPVAQAVAQAQAEAVRDTVGLSLALWVALRE